MDWGNSYVKFAVVFITLVVFFMGFYYIFSPVQNCIREITTHNQIVLDSSLSTLSFGHSGRTDSSGGHNCSQKSKE